jgi:hypothetical protein
MNNVQLYFAIAIPTFSILVGIIIGIFQSNHVLNQLNLRFTSLESNMGSRIGSLESNVTSRFGLVEADLKMLVRATNEFDVRLARLEERLAR